MSKAISTAHSVEIYLDDLRESVLIGAANMPSLGTRDNDDYRLAVERLEYWEFIQSADYHYFTARVLFLHYITEYSQFCAYQCIENYLKAFLKYEQQIPPKSHDLQELLRRCRATEPSSESFVHTNNILTIIAKFEPFYEYARYPVQKLYPKTPYGFLIPDDIYVLDYFVMKMREILSIPSSTWDILKDGHLSLHLCQKHSPDFYSIFFDNNLNFPENKP